MQSKTERNETLVNAYLAGTPREALSAQFGLSDISIYRVLRSAGVELRNERQERTSEYRSDLQKRNAVIEADYQAGLDVPDLMQRYGLSKNTVHRVLRDVPSRQTSRQRSIEERNRNLVTDFRAGTDFDKLGQLYDLSKSRVAQVLRFAGIDLDAEYADRLAKRNSSIVAAYQEGTSVAQLRQQHNLSQTSINRVLHGVLNRLGRRERRARDADVVADYCNGTTKESLESKYGLSTDQVYRILFASGISERKQKAQRNKQIVAAYANSAEVSDLAEQHDLTTERIRQIICASNVPLRAAYPDLTGKIFNKLTVIKLDTLKIDQGERWWKCRCDCGNEATRTTHSLVSGRLKSCGCLQGNLKHGHSRRGKMTREYFLLKSAKQRAKKRGVPFNLTIEDIRIPDMCPVLGIPLRRGKEKLHDNSPTLDRMVPERGYVRGNVMVISHLANRIKTNANPDQLIQAGQWARANTTKDHHDP